MNFKTIGKVFTSKFVGTGASFYKKGTYRAADSQKLWNTALNVGTFLPLGLKFCFHVCCLQTERLKCTKLQFLLHLH